MSREFFKNPDWFAKPENSYHLMMAEKEWRAACQADDQYKHSPVLVGQGDNCPYSSWAAIPPDRPLYPL